MSLRLTKMSETLFVRSTEEISENEVEYLVETLADALPDGYSVVYLPSEVETPDKDEVKDVLSSLKDE